MPAMWYAMPLVRCWWYGMSSLASRQQIFRQIVEPIGSRPVAANEAADLPREQRRETGKKQRAGEFAGGERAHQQTGHREGDQRQRHDSGGIDVRPQAAD